VTVRVDVADGIVSSLRWEGHGCVVSTAAASALAALAPGLRVPELAALAARYFASLDPDARPDDHPALADTDVFAGIGRFPLRAGCASLARRTALDAMAG
jgi:nitrogen fixation NifU-like protein